MKGIEKIARAICEARGIDPNQRGVPGLLPVTGYGFTLIPDQHQLAWMFFHAEAKACWDVMSTVVTRETLPTEE